MFRNFLQILLVLFSIVGLFFFTGCPEANQQYSLAVEIDQGKVIFSHPKLAEEIKKGNFCVVRRITVVRKGENNYADTVWQLDGRSDGGWSPEEALPNPFIVYGEGISGMTVWREPKALRDGLYSASGSVSVYNREKGFLYEMPLSNEFSLATDASGKLIVAESKRKT